MDEQIAKLLGVTLGYAFLAAGIATTTDAVVTDQHTPSFILGLCISGGSGAMIHLNSI